MPLMGAVTRAHTHRAHDPVDTPLAYPFPDTGCQAGQAYGLFTVMEIWHVSGARIAAPEVRWGFGHGSMRNDAGCCVDLRALWTPGKFALLRENNPHFDVISFHEICMHVEAWASPGLLNYVIRAVTEGRLSEIHNVEHLRKRLRLSGLKPLIDARLPIDPAEWWKHPMFASTPPKRAA